MIGGVTRQGRVARSVRPSNPLSWGQGGATRLAGVGFAILNSRKIHFGGSFASLLKVAIESPHSTGGCSKSSKRV